MNANHGVFEARVLKSKAQFLQYGGHDCAGNPSTFNYY